MDSCALKIIKLFWVWVGFFLAKFISLMTDIAVASIQTFSILQIKNSKEKLFFFQTSQNQLRFVLENLFAKFHFENQT